MAKIKPKKPSRTVWSSDIGDLSLWNDAIIDMGLQNAPEHVKRAEIENLNTEYYYDERMNLKIGIASGIVAIADCGLWDGRHIHMMEIGDCLANCLDHGTTGVQDGEFRWYVDRYGNFRCEARHHDGVNHIVYRMWKPNITKEKKQQFYREMRLAGRYNSAIVGKYTLGVGKFVSEVYGW